MRNLLLVVGLLVALGGCTSEGVRSDFQEWKDVAIAIETRPPEIRPGMMEFLVLANRGPRKVAHDLLISIRIGETGRWVQAIQDGHVGVYRRALRVSNPATDVLNVHIKYGDEETVLKYPLTYGMAKN